MIDRINAFLRQDIAEKVSLEVGTSKLKELFQGDDHEKV
jgi:hypothetical protein